MLLAADRGYEVELVYLDADNPKDPKTINHVAVFVRVGDFQTFIETTTKTNGLTYYDDVSGWYFPVT